MHSLLKLKTGDSTTEIVGFVKTIESLKNQIKNNNKLNRNLKRTLMSTLNYADQLTLHVRNVFKPVKILSRKYYTEYDRKY